MDGDWFSTAVRATIGFLMAIAFVGGVAVAWAIVLLINWIW